MAKPSQQEALIYLMVTMSAADRNMTNEELAMIGSLSKTVPSISLSDQSELVKIAERCSALLQEDDGFDEVMNIVKSAIDPTLYETAYYLAVEVAAADKIANQEELRLLILIRDHLGIGKLEAAAIEFAIGARYRNA